MTVKMGRYRYWGDRKPDTSRPLLTFTRGDAVAAARRTAATEPAASSGTLRIYGPIDSWGGWWGVSAKEVAQALDLLGDVDQIVVRVNSPGGESSEGRAIMNLLRAHSATCIGVVDGAAYSAASYIAVGCDETVMAPGTTMMIHDTHAYVYGDAAALRKEADVVDKISYSGAELYAEVAGGTVEQWREKQRAETWYTAADAVADGLADRVAVVPDAGPAETAGEQGPEVVDADAIDDRARASYDLSLFERVPAAIARHHQPPAASADGSTTTEGGSAVAFSDEQLTTIRRELGLAEDADEATITAALTEALTERADPAATATAAAGQRVVSETEYNELRENARRGAEAATRLHKMQREADLDDYRDRFLPANRDSWRGEYDRNPQATVEALKAMPVIVPTEELGHAVDPSQTEPKTLDDVRGEPNYQNWRF